MDPGRFKLKSADLRDIDQVGFLHGWGGVLLRDSKSRSFKSLVVSKKSSLGVYSTGL